MRTELMVALSLIGVCLLETGCASSRVASANADDSISLADLGPAVSPPPMEQGTFFLGAGDALGQAVFANYLVVRTNPGLQFAGANP